VISVMELWYLKPGTEAEALGVMQEMDDLVGPGAHDHPGWCGHAHFFQSHAERGTVLMLYPWRSKELHEDLRRREEPLLADFYDRYCARPRDIQYWDELEVEVEHDHDHGGHGHG
jgi:hypothetical protein